MTDCRAIMRSGMLTICSLDRMTRRSSITCDRGQQAGQGSVCSGASAQCAGEPAGGCAGCAAWRTLLLQALCAKMPNGYSTKLPRVPTLVMRRRKMPRRLMICARWSGLQGRTRESTGCW